MNKQAVAKATCQQIYAEARKFFEEYVGAEGYCGFCILQGPPLYEPPILFIGYQPGRSDEGQQEREREWEVTWPSKCNNATGHWKLSKRLQFMFTASFLERCVGVNAIFLRSPNMEAYNKDFTVDDRRSIQKFCVEQTRKIIEVINPPKIATIGFGTGELFSEDWDNGLHNDRETLTKTGKIAGKPAIAMRHLTSSRLPPISETDLKLIRNFVDEYTP